MRYNYLFIVLTSLIILFGIYYVSKRSVSVGKEGLETNSDTNTNDNETAITEEKPRKKRSVCVPLKTLFNQATNTVKNKVNKTIK